MTELEIRKAIIENCLKMNATGLNQGTSGNLSARYKDVMIITPSGIAYEALKPGDLATMPINKDYGSWEGPLKPSTEWRFHLDIMIDRPDVGGIVHTHSTYATILSIAGKEIPACHYMIAAFGGPMIRCADYATFGTEELSANALKALKDRTGCILANHGMIATGANIAKAMWLAVELETIAKQYYQSLLIGGPNLLSDAEIANVMERFKGYGLQDKKSANSNAKPKTRAKTPAKTKAAGKTSAAAKPKVAAKRKAPSKARTQTKAGAQTKARTQTKPRTRKQA
ncbi:class II aldolase/adducin family protein [Denitrobaculum tricleocarpae]|uniref:Class II aldolase n=1 Tax=Denitrobaculum tricleocarpae TaxID=2591009 RepID=A0A545U0S6_9PROT|nr:class II aldolase/adducin family protein [Denitrobaculum tricleocarpae]TQV83077.1 class II aldolase [Denitrobaculum tricleocarpae]